MSNKLLSLICALGAAAPLAAEFANAPDAVMERYNLSKEEMAAVKSGDYDAVARLSGLDEGSLYATKSVIKSYDNDTI